MYDFVNFYFFYVFYWNKVFIKLNRYICICKIYKRLLSYEKGFVFKLRGNFVYSIGV